jgi:dTDP-4-dehydrorhamnose 3,5-epimerase
MIEGVRIIKKLVFEDNRGTFFKPYNNLEFRDLGIDFIPEEIFVTASKKGVVRGMHFQAPPHQHSKVIACLNGSVTDVIVDLRAYSSTFKHVETFELSGSDDTVVYLPEGIAHGFLSHEDSSSLIYMVSKGYSPEHDTGVRWDSIDFDWGFLPVVSERDSNFLGINDFNNPFEIKK